MGPGLKTALQGRGPIVCGTKLAQSSKNVEMSHSLSLFTPCENGLSERSKFLVCKRALQKSYQKLGCGASPVVGVLALLFRFDDQFKLAELRLLHRPDLPHDRRVGIDLKVFHILRRDSALDGVPDARPQGVLEREEHQSITMRKNQDKTISL